MPLIQVYKCPHCRHLFEDKSKYLTHLHKVARERLTKRILSRRVDEYRIKVQQISTIKDIEECLPAILVEFASRVYGFDAKGKDPKHHISFRFDRMIYDSSCSNSHVCPHNGATNWGNYKKDLPTGYPGWYGYVRIRKSREFDKVPEFDFGGEHYKDFGLKFGSGSGSHELFTVSSQHGITLFEADWPLFKLMECLLA